LRIRRNRILRLALRASFRVGPLLISFLFYLLVFLSSPLFSLLSEPFRKCPLKAEPSCRWNWPNGQCTRNDVPEKGNPSILKLPQSSVLICARVRLATFFPTYGYFSSPSKAGPVSRHLVASIISSCHTITAPSFVRPQSNSRDVTPSFRPIANAGRVLSC
jgi:hypothetical protein